MRNFLLLIVYLCIPFISYSQTEVVKGRIIGEKLENAVGAEILNGRTKHKVNADGNGIYNIDAIVGDTLTFYFVGYTKEKRIVKDQSHIDVLLMNKNVNDLGAIWTKKQWKKANKQIEKRYSQLEGEAQKTGKWNY